MLAPNLAGEPPSAAHDCNISWLPYWISGHATELIEVTTQVPLNETASWVCQRPRPAHWAGVAKGMRSAGERLKDLPVARIVTAIDRVAARWCDPYWSVRLAVRESVARATGFSVAAVDRSFDLELRNYRADSLWRALRRELGDPSCLDRPARNADLHGTAMAIGPDLVLAIFTGNVPGLPALSMVRSLIVKAPVIAKVASGEPSFAAAFAASLAEELPALGDALLVTYWDRDEPEVLAEVAAQADVVIAYGGDAAIHSVRQALPMGPRVIEHGHKLSLGYLGARYVERQSVASAAKAVATDVAAFNQQACIAPQAYFVQGSRRDAERIAAAIGEALAAEARHCPVGGLRIADAARVRLARAQRHWHGSLHGSQEIWHDDALEWTVLLGEQLGVPDGIGHRVLRVIAVESLDQALDQIRPFGSYLQNVAVGCIDEGELAAAAASLAKIGASRVCEPGRMAEPSMMWRHDGRTCIAELVRWCDIEMHAALHDKGAHEPTK
ncbi:MAG: acyl-CoA reductase [Proteobacteria bacterium]|nr:MAG: acyl-CoA reductase [Pseudomonadota bacterium]